MNLFGSFLKRIFRRPSGDTHDYSFSVWGHAVDVLRVIDDGAKLRVAGFGHGVKENDYIILPNKGQTTRYQVTCIRYCGDPRDMWFADVVFSPREVQA